MIYIPIIGALALASGTILQRVVLKKSKVGIKTYQVAEFLAIVLIMLPFIYFFWKLEPAALELKNILIFSSVIVLSIIANLFVFFSMKWEKVSNLEPAKILEPLFVILLAIIFSFIFGETLYDRNLKILVPALIAGGALVFSHIKRHHISFNKYFIAAIAGSFFFASELVVTRLILDFYSPISFYFLRCSAILLISFLIFRPNLSKLTKKSKFQIIITGIIWVIFRVIVYYGYITYGVIFTTLIIMLGPIFIYIFAYKFLNEKPNWKNISAAAIIVASVVYALLA
jgi:drug/metabolite transporter (DMT)-like permease